MASLLQPGGRFFGRWNQVSHTWVHLKRRLDTNRHLHVLSSFNPKAELDELHELLGFRLQNV